MGTQMVVERPLHEQCGGHVLQRCLSVGHGVRVPASDRPAPSSSTWTCRSGIWATWFVLLPLQRKSHPHYMHEHVRSIHSQSYPPAQKSRGGHPSCDPAQLTTSSGTVGQWEHRHRAMAGSRHLHYPRNGIAHFVARINYLNSSADTTSVQRLCPLAQLRW